MTMNRRTGVVCAISLSLAVLAGCSSVPINKNDNSKPKVTIKVEGPNGYEEEASDDRGNNSETPPTNIMCVVEDPEGVSSLHLEVSDPTVDTVSCAGGLYGSSMVEGLPASADISVTSNEVPTTLANLLVIPGGFLYAAKPFKNAPDPCSPAANTHITIRCTGWNWSSDAAVHFDVKTLQINF
jgi:hypothetical protein